jgi:hypothetical protein
VSEKCTCDRLFGSHHEPCTFAGSPASKSVSELSARRELVAEWLMDHYLAARAGQSWSQTADAKELLSLLDQLRPELVVDRVKTDPTTGDDFRVYREDWGASARAAIAASRTMSAQDGAAGVDGRGGQ